MSLFLLVIYSFIYTPKAPVISAPPEYKPPVKDVPSVPDPNTFQSKRTIDVVEGMKSWTSDFNMYLDCQGNPEPAPENIPATKIWALLAYASMYDSTGDQMYIPKIRELEESLYYIHGFFYRNSVKKDYPEWDYYGANLSQASFLSLKVMTDRMNAAYSLLKGKGVLKNEVLFEKMIVENGVGLSKMDVYVPQAQTASMISTSLSATLPYMTDSGYSEAEKQKVSYEASYWANESWRLSYADNIERCWAIMAQYDYLKATGQSTTELATFFFAPIKETILTKEQVVAPVELQPCMEVLYDLYKDSDGVKDNRQKKYLQNFVELNNALLAETQLKPEECDGKQAFGLKVGAVGGDPNRVFLSDNAYQLYLITRPELKDEVDVVIP
ncbi:MAG: hypothetical protein HGA85_01520 [Nanoarchaeota archaeon]|nr:hypothetical protein [Nanoarchaeota archaeon]